MTGLPSAMASSTTAPPHSNRLGRTRQSAAFSRALQSACDSQPANWTVPADESWTTSSGRDSSRASCCRRSPFVTVAEDPEPHRRALARGGEGLQQQLDALPADEASHEHEGDDVAGHDLAFVGRPQRQVDAVFDQLGDAASGGNGQRGAGPVVRDQKHRRASLTGHQHVQDPCDRSPEPDQRLLEDAASLAERRRIFHASVHWPDDHRSAQAE